MQDSKALVDEPYARLPQLTWNYGIGLPAGVEANFTLNTTSSATASKWSMVAERSPGWQAADVLSELVPFCKPATALSPRKSACTTPNTGCRRKRPGARRNRQLFAALPVASVDAGLVFERDSNWFGQSLTQTLNPGCTICTSPTAINRACPTSTARATTPALPSCSTKTTMPAATASTTPTN